MSFNFSFGPGLPSSAVSELGNKRNITLTVDSNSANHGHSSPHTVDRVSKEYNICNSTVLQVKVTWAYRQTTNSGPQVAGFVFIKFASLRTDDPISYTLYISCDKFSISNKKFISDDGTWHLIGQTTELKFNLNILAEMILTPIKSPFEDLFSDDELTDFELKGEDGSVKMHKAILAAASPVLRRMLSGPWRERTEGSIDVAGTSQMTLQHLKEYVYLQKLPSTGLEQLLLLAHYYMMTELEDKCVVKLISDLAPQNAVDLNFLAARHGIPKMALAIFYCIEKGFLKVNDMSSLLLKSNEAE